MDVYIIENGQDFSSYFPKLKQSAKNNNNYIIGLDIEMCIKSSDCSGYWCLNPVSPLPCLIQLSTSTVCLLIRLTKFNKYLPSILIKLLTSDGWIKFGVGIEHDLKILSINYNLGHCGGGIELKNLANLAGIKTPNLSYLYSLFYPSLNIPTKTLSNWYATNLTEFQLKYATYDAYMSYKLGISFTNPMINLLKTKQKDNVTLIFHNNNYNNDNDEDDENDDNIKNNEIIEINNNNTNNLFIDYENITNLNNKNNINNNYIGRLNEISQRLSINPPQFVKLNNSIILKWNNKSIIEKNLSTDIKLMIIKQKLAKQLYNDHNL